MGDHSASKGSRWVSVDLGNLEGKLERLPRPEKGPEKIRLSCWNKDQKQPFPIDLSEEELVTLLRRAIRAGLLSPEFIHNLHDDIEILILNGKIAVTVNGRLPQRHGDTEITLRRAENKKKIFFQNIFSVSSSVSLCLCGKKHNLLINYSLNRL